MRQTTFAKPGEVQRQWRLVDAEGQRLGRLATRIAVVLMGKHRPEYTPHVDTGDFVVVTNAEKVVLTGAKAQQKFRKTFSGHPGGQRMESYESLLRRRPEIVIEDAVRRMLPKSRLGRQMMRKLKVYRGADHPHQAQRPEPMDVHAA
ncbi:MAG: 50S ribosomal protein L13 [Planctomycetota bacterium]|nr:MAG: 50S ribosomal protein L13 [Planctomycetota bacterium]